MKELIDRLNATDDEVCDALTHAYSLIRIKGRTEEAVTMAWNKHQRHQAGSCGRVYMLCYKLLCDLVYNHPEDH